MAKKKDELNKVNDELGTLTTPPKNKKDPQPGSPAYEELKAKLAALQDQVNNGGKELGFRVSDKGGVSVYGLGRFPVTLYYEQWMRLLDAADAIRAFAESNKSKLKLREAA